MIARLILLVLTTVVTACASGPRKPEWTAAPGRPMEQAVFYRDEYECRRDASYHYRGVGAWGGPLAEQIKVDKDLYRSCMRAHGWVHADD